MVGYGITRGQIDHLHTMAGCVQMSQVCVNKLRKDRLILPSLARFLLTACMPGLRRLFANEKVAATVSTYLAEGPNNGSVWELFNIVEVRRCACP